MIIEINESEKTIRPKQDYSIKEVLDFADRWKLDLNKWKVAACTCNSNNNELK